MKVSLVPSAAADTGAVPCQYATSLVINDHVAIDAGSLGYFQVPTWQAQVRHLFLSHSHIDHIGSLPTFVENIIGLTPAPVNVYASEAVQESLRLDIFNGRVWPDFLHLKYDNKPFLQLHTITSGQTVEVEGMRVTAVAVDHVVPTLGFILEDNTAAVVVPSDTGPTEEIWERSRAIANLRAVFLEVTFPDAMQRFAEISKHLTPATFMAEVNKLGRPARFLALHLKAQFREQVARELLAHKHAQVEIAQMGTVYEF